MTESSILLNSADRAKPYLMFKILKSFLNRHSKKSESKKATILLFSLDE